MLTVTTVPWQAQGTALSTRQRAGRGFVMYLFRFIIRSPYARSGCSSMILLRISGEPVRPEYGGRFLFLLSALSLRW